MGRAKVFIWPLLLILLTTCDTRTAAGEEASTVPLEIKDIRFVSKGDGKEAVYIYSNRDFTPSVFGLNSKHPRLVIDIKGLPTYKKGLSKIPVNGRFIKQIRIYFHKKSNKLRVVLDHDPSMSYIVSQIFYKAEKIYVVEVEEQQEGEGK